MLPKFLLPTLIFIGISLTNIAQDFQTPFKNFMKYSNIYDEEYDYEKAETELKKFKSEFKKALKNNFNSAINSLKNEDILVDMFVSPDEQLYVFDWDDMTGGTMRFFDGIYVVKSGSSIIIQDKYEPCEDFCINPKVYGLYQVQSSKGKRIYVIFEKIIGSTAYSGHSVRTITIENSKINDNATFIRTKTGMKNSISYEMDWSLLVNSDHEFNGEDYLQFDENTKTILIPLITENGKLTSKKIKYIFNGEFFEKQ